MEHSHDSYHQMSESGTGYPRGVTTFYGQGINNSSGKFNVCGDVNIVSGVNDIDSLQRGTLKRLRVTNPLDDQKRIQNQKGGLFDKSYKWILNIEDFRKWRDSTEGQLLWIQGDPGKGKTMLLCGIIKELTNSKMESQNIGYYFCQATDPQLNNAKCKSQQRELLEIVRKEIDEASGDNFNDANGWTALCRIFASLIKEMEDRQQTTYLIVDALDECLEDRYDLLKWIVGISSSRIKMLVSSRNWSSIEDGLSGATQKTPLRLELYHNYISNAVDSYINDQVDKLQTSKRLNKDDVEEIQSYLKSNSKDTFLWVSLVCQELEKSPLWKIRREVKKFPPGLNQLYELMASQFLTEGAENADMCCQILAIQAHAYRPLSLTELLPLVELLKDARLEHLQDVIQRCGSFLTVSEGKIYFVHQSAKDYLIDHASDSRFGGRLSTGHHTIAVQSIRALSQTLRENIYQLPSPESYVGNGMRYACVYWIDHLNDAEMAVVGRQDLDDDGLVYRFLKEHILHWFEALSLLKIIDSGVEAVMKLRSLLVRIEMDRKDLYKLVDDAIKFLRYYRLLIETTPRQVYDSGLIFSPTRSVIKRLFPNPEYLLMDPTLESDWCSRLHMLRGHESKISSVAFSPNSRYLVTASSGAEVRIWDMRIGHCLHRLEDDNHSILSAAFSPNGNFVALCSSRLTVRIWDLTTGTYVQTLESDHSVIEDHPLVAFPDNESVISLSSCEGWAWTWNIKTGQILQKIEIGDFEDKLEALRLSRNGRRAAWISRDKRRINVVDLEAGQTLWSPETMPGKIVGYPGLSADGEFVGFVRECDEHESVAFWVHGNVNKKPCYKVQRLNVTTSECITLTHFIEYSNDIELALSPDGRYVAVIGDHHQALWDIEADEWKSFMGEVPYDPKMMPFRPEFSPDSKLLISAVYEYAISVWKVEEASIQYGQIRKDSFDYTPVESVEFSPDGALIGVMDHTNILRIWDTVKNEFLREVSFEGLSALVEFIPHKRLLACAMGRPEKESRIGVYNPDTGAYLWLKDTGDEESTSLRCSTDGKKLASHSEFQNIIRIWSVEKGWPLSTIQVEIPQVVSLLAFTADGTRVAGVGHFGLSVSFWDVDTCKQSPITTLAVDEDENKKERVSLTTLYSDQDGNIVDQDGNIVDQEGSIDSEKEKETESRVTGISPDGRYFVYHSGDNDALIVDTETGNQLKRLNGFWNYLPHFCQWDQAGLSTHRGIYNTAALLNDPRVSIEYDCDDIPDGALWGLGHTLDKDWILKDGKRHIWVPEESWCLFQNRSGKTITSGRTLNQISCIGLPRSELETVSEAGEIGTEMDIG
ncbi:hypothetical protein GQX73_g7442 [Xylaria multiplex]|uniref:NACHT domain-containing protein n=1 Tax=Xylaria multiplex TaxID=323545 RepID=A0A7C8IXK9_9PEZI|nr:hypothetical protein GQX73_g7442 [Xylaria multiplex]